MVANLQYDKRGHMLQNEFLALIVINISSNVHNLLSYT